jgi:hypothetical protein
VSCSLARTVKSNSLALFILENFLQQVRSSLLFPRNHFLDKSPPIDDVISLGFIPRAMQLFSEGNPQIQFELCWIFTNLACGTTPQIQCLVENGAIPCLMSLLIHPQDEVRYLETPPFLHLTPIS